MPLSKTLFLVSMLVVSTQASFAVAREAAIPAASTEIGSSAATMPANAPPALGWSSSMAEFEAPMPEALADPAASMSFAQAISGASGTRPFSAFAVSVKFGLEGVGFDVATPIARKWNVRAGASFFNYTGAFTTDGITINPDLKFRKGAASLDYYPWGGSFRVSPGLVFYNGNHLSATASVPGGTSFDLNDVTYISSTTDPVRGSAEIAFGNKAAPSITVGFGNMIPRHGGHWSVPFEVGFAYIGRPAFVYNLSGTACNQFGCRSVATDPEIQANLKAQQKELNDDVAPLRFFPIVSLGLGYRF